ncbi:MAG: glycosyltransferase [Candidatus Omnitrophica bacterium]|nr:glycosyltransferase [Candidatus Omnitrophota bacterium]
MILDSLEKIDYPKDRLEVLVSAGRMPPRQRNLAAQEAAGTYLLFFDDDVSVPPDYLHELLRLYQQWDSDALGGPCLPDPNKRSLQQMAIAHVLGSWWVLGPLCARYRPAKATRHATDRQLILCNQSIRRDAFRKSGGFNERLFPNEENELLDRFRRNGLKLGYSPSLATRRPTETSCVDHWKKVFHYGRGRGRQLKIAFSFRNLEHLLFMLVETTILGGLLLPWPGGKWLWLLCLLWLAAPTLEAIRRLQSLPAGLLTGVVIAGTHLSYWVGFWCGLLTWDRRREKLENVDVSIRRINFS